MFDFVKNNTRYFLAILAIFAALAINRNFFINPSAESSGCQGENCLLSSDEEPSLDDKKKAFYFNDIVEGTQKGKFYRLKLRAMTDRDTKIKAEISTAADERELIGEIELKKSDDFVYLEKAFPVSGNYTDLVFEKESRDGATVFLKDARISELNISSLEEFQKLRGTIFGEMNTSVINQSQTGNPTLSFLQLENKGAILGQVFRSQGDYVSGVTLAADVLRDGNEGKRKYRLELREAESVDGTFKLKKPLQSIGFSLEEIEKMRNREGKVRFPIFSPVEKDKYYFIGINADKVESDQFNRLVLKGTSNGDVYPDGAAVFKLAGSESRLTGDLYFVVHGAEFKMIDGERLLLGASVEDVGGDRGMFTYQQKGDFSDFIDLFSRTEDVDFTQGKKVVFGTAKEGSNFVYRFNFIYPAKKVRLSVKQASTAWIPAKLSYSLDGENWSEIDPEKNEDEKMTAEFVLENPARVLYLKAASGEKTDDGQDDFYGIKELKIITGLEEK